MSAAGDPSLAARADAGAVEAPLLSPGQIFLTHYEVVRLLGRGGMGEVHEARHRFLGRRVAVKILRLRRSQSNAARDRMAKEARVLCEFDHPNIVRVHDAGVLDDLGGYLVMEYLEGDTLRGYLEERGRLPVEAALRFVSDWADALGAVHEHGILHRDVKPENLFITDAFIPKLLDFGAALDASAERITAVGATIGTPAYMAPEHLEARPDLDRRVDVYGLGTILFEMLTGTHPFVYPSDERLPSARQIGQRHLDDPPRRLRDVAPDLPELLEPIVARALAKARDDRWPSMPALRKELRAAHRILVARAKDAASPTSSSPSHRLARQLSGEFPVLTRGPRGTELMVQRVDKAELARRQAAIVASRAPASTSSETSPRVQLAPRRARAVATARVAAPPSADRSPRDLVHVPAPAPIVRMPTPAAAAEHAIREAPQPDAANLANRLTWGALVVLSIILIALVVINANRVGRGAQPAEATTASASPSALEPDRLASPSAPGPTPSASAVAQSAGAPSAPSFTPPREEPPAATTATSAATGAPSASATQTRPSGGVLPPSANVAQTAVRAPPAPRPASASPPPRPGVAPAPTSRPSLTIFE